MHLRRNGEMSHIGLGAPFQGSPSQRRTPSSEMIFASIFTSSNNWLRQPMHTWKKKSNKAVKPFACGSLGRSALRACSGTASPFLPEHSLHAERRLPGRYVQKNGAIVGHDNWGFGAKPELWRCRERFPCWRNQDRIWCCATSNHRKRQRFGLIGPERSLRSREAMLRSSRRYPRMRCA